MGPRAYGGGRDLLNNQALEDIDNDCSPSPERFGAVTVYNESNDIHPSAIDPKTRDICPKLHME